MGISVPRQHFLTYLGVAHPIVLAPMAGTGTPSLAAAVSNAGGLGSLAIGAMTAEAARAAIRELRSLTVQPFNINVFAHKPPKLDRVKEAAWLSFLAPYFADFGETAPTELHTIYPSFVDDDAMLEVLLEARPAVVSFHFGLPPIERINALHDAGCMLFATATSLEEALAIEAAGIDVIVAQGIEAGGHRGIFDTAAYDEELSTLALVSALVARTTRPIVAAGGVMNGAGIAAALAGGAQAAQLGTAFIDTPESAADAAHRAALTQRGSHTVLTSAISGRPARCVENRFTALGRDPKRPDIPDYPIAYDAGKALHAAARRSGEMGYAAHWAGQGHALSRSLGAAALVETLVAELHAVGMA
ncbi:MAG: nitronate monooxygenase [Betaproteobacteria bacterium]|nr:nitronate monooxygenase [Betaproteobacteria bacterium]